MINTKQLLNIWERISIYVVPVLVCIVLFVPLAIGVASLEHGSLYNPLPSWMVHPITLAILGIITLGLLYMAKDQILDAIFSFFLWIAGIPRQDMLDGKLDAREEQKYLALGIVIFVPVIAGFACAYFVGTDIFHMSTMYAILMGLAWSFVVLSIDRALVTTMARNVRGKYSFSSFALRLSLAFVFGVVISTAIELRIFKTEIEQEKLTQQVELISHYDSLKTAEILPVDVKIRIEQNKVDAKYADLQAEVNTSISGRAANYGRVAAIKDSIWREAKREFNEVILPRLQAEKKAIEDRYDQKLALELHAKSDGLAARISYLAAAGERNHSIWWAHIFVFGLFLILELIPVITKMLIRPGKYDSEKILEDIDRQKAHKTKLLELGSDDIGPELTESELTKDLTSRLKLVKKLDKEMAEVPGIEEEELKSMRASVAMKILSKNKLTGFSRGGFFSFLQGKRYKKRVA